VTSKGSGQTGVDESELPANVPLPYFFRRHEEPQQLATVFHRKDAKANTKNAKKTKFLTPGSSADLAVFLCVFAVENLSPAAPGFMPRVIPD